MLIATSTIPESQSLSPGQYDFIFYLLVITVFALFASFLYSVTGRGEVSARYRPAVLASMCITGIASVAYAVLIIKFDTGYDRLRRRQNRR